jgi:hypothetical protein
MTSTFRLKTPKWAEEHEAAQCKEQSINILRPDNKDRKAKERKERK